MTTTTLTPAQAHAIVCAGGIQPHSITPDAAQALLQRNASAHAAWCEAHGVIDSPARRAVATLDGCAPVIHLPYSVKGIHELDIQCASDKLAALTLAGATHVTYTPTGQTTAKPRKVAIDLAPTVLRVLRLYAHR